MYLRYFGLEQKPFSITPDPEFLYYSANHLQALAVLEYGLFEQAGITVITGDVGTGKTTLLRHLLRRIDYSKLTVGLISNLHESMGNLLDWIAFAFDVQNEGLDKVQTFRVLQDYIVEQYANGRRVVLIMDEAQNANAGCLEELRMLSNINADKDQLLQIILVGQPQLLERLCEPSMMQVAQRVTAEYHLEPFNLLDTAAYIRNRVRIAAGRDLELFESLAISVIYYFSGGVPRLVNTLCDHCLVLAYAADLPKVCYQIALDSVRDKRIGGVRRFWRPSEDAERARVALRETSGIDMATIAAASAFGRT